MLKKYTKGFTLIELLVVIGILGILLAIVLIAINPARQFALANNTKRQSDATALLNAIGQYSASNKGKLPLNMPTVAQSPAEVKGDGTATGVGNICASIVPTYIASLPEDPAITTPFTVCTVAYTTGYEVSVDATGRVTVQAITTDPVDGVAPVISVTR